MKRILILCIVFCTIIISFTTVFAGTGGLPFEVFNQGVGVRALAMGGASVADSADASAFFWNPAALDDITKNQAFLSYETFYDTANYDNLSYVAPIGRYGGLGIGVGSMIYGTYQVVDSDGNQKGEDSMTDILITGSYGKSVYAGILAGASVKAIIRTIGGDAYSGLNMDVGFFKSLDGVFDIGLNLKNIIPISIKYDTDEEPFIFSMRLGFSAKLLNDKLVINADVEKHFIDVVPVYFAGIEYNVLDFVYLRAGMDAITDTNAICAGIGVAYNGFALDYGMSYTEVNLSHKAGLSYSFGGYELLMKPEPEVFSPLGGNRKTYIRLITETKYEIYKWKAEIKDSKGKVVKTWIGAGAPDSTLIWDGLDKDGMPHKEGDYKVRIVITDENDTVIKSKDAKITISSSAEREMPLFGE